MLCISYQKLVFVWWMLWHVTETSELQIFNSWKFIGSILFSLLDASMELLSNFLIQIPVDLILGQHSFISQVCPFKILSMFTNGLLLFYSHLTKLLFLQLFNQIQCFVVQLCLDYFCVIHVRIVSGVDKEQFICNILAYRQFLVRWFMNWISL